MKFTQGVAQTSIEPTHGPSKPVLQKLFIIFFVQIFLLILVSFIEQSGPVFVQRHFFGYDFHDFYVGASELFHHVDPYALGRLYTPPASILVGIAFIWLPFKAAAFAAFVLNLALIFASLTELSRQFGMSQSNRLALLGLAAVFYPVYFVVERGNADAIMLALVVFGFSSKNRYVKALLLGASVALKLYSGLLLVIMLRRRRNWKTVASALLVAAVLQLPFLHLAPSFWATFAGRSQAFAFRDNISPAAIFWLFGNGIPAWTKIYLVLWAGTLVYRLRRGKDEDMTRVWPSYVPWMISYPTLVFPYTGVFALALLALIAGECQSRSLYVSEERVVTGVILLGFQATAWTTAFDFFFPKAYLFHLICAMGNLFILIGGCFLPSYDRVPEIEPSFGTV